MLARPGRSVLTKILIAVMMFGTLSSRAGDAVMLSDIFTGFASASSNPSNFIAVGNKCFFTANDGTNGTELYISDGFSSGTFLVKDIFPGPGSSSASNMINFGGTLIFTASDGSTGTELWKSDGTAAGTVQIKDIRTGPGSSSPSAFTIVGSTLYFTADDGPNGRELWKTDGTTAGTVMVKDINATDTGASGVASSVRIAVIGTTMYFAASDGVNGIELWKSDGTDAGTSMVGDINAGAGNALTGSNEIVTLGSFVYFPATGSTGRELYRSDGNAPTLVGELNSGGVASSANANPDQLTVAGGFVYFRATGGNILTSDTELYRTNGGAPTLFDLNIQTSGFGDLSSSPTLLTAVGTDLFCRATTNTGTMAATANGTELVRVNAAGTVTHYNIAAGSTSSSPNNLIAVGTTLLFTANDAANGLELYSVTSGSAAATLHNINTTAGASSSPSRLVAFDATQAVFQANDGSTGIEPYLWNAGTVTQIRDLNPGSGSSFPTGATVVNLAVGGNTVFFSANDGFGTELFKSDLTSGGTIRVKDLNTSANSGNPQQLTDFNGTLYFQATENTQGTELYKSNGTVAGTVLSSDIVPGSNSSSPFYFKVFNGALYFSAYDTTNGTELQKFDGNTVSNAANLEPAAGDSYPYDLRVAGNNLYFQAFTSANGDYRFFQYDGATATQVTVGAMPPYTYAFPFSSFAVGNVLYFNSYTYDSTMTDVGYELWRADGSTASLVKDINAGTSSSFPDQFAAIGSTLFFVADDGVNGRELWKSDGTDAGTMMVKDILSGSGSSDPNRLTVVGNVLYFTATDGNNGTELWKSDGTDAGTVMVKDIFPGAIGSNPHSLTSANGVLLFAASDGSTGFELWKSDGTTTGTALVKDINPGAASSMPFLGLEVPILPAGGAGRSVFAASNGTDGTELWKTDGTDAGTVQIQDINPGGSSSTPDGFTVSGQFVFFRANNGSNGFELWALPLSTLLNPPAIVSLPVASGAAGSAFNFMIGLTGTDPINVTTSELPAGLVLSGSTISGVPTTAGVYTVTVTATNSSGTTSQTLKIIITGNGVSNSTVDSDSDGFTDELEIAAGGDPNLVGVTPFGSAPAGTPETLFVSKLQIGLNFAKTGLDSASLSGLVAVPDGFVVAGSKAVLDIGGVIQTFTLDAKGGSKVASDSFKISIKAKKGVVAAQTAKFSAKYSKGTFQSKLVDEGLTSITTKNTPATVTVQMLFNSKLFKSDVSQLYNATAGKTGKTKLPTGAAILPTR